MFSILVYEGKTGLEGQRGVMGGRDLGGRKLVQEVLQFVDYLHHPPVDVLLHLFEERCHCGEGHAAAERFQACTDGSYFRLIDCCITQL